MRLRLGDTARGLIGSASARLLVMPISGVASILTARLLTERLGIETYAIFALCMSIFLLFPFADLGAGAALTNATATIEMRPAQFAVVLRRAMTVTSLSGGLFISGCLLLAVAEMWPRLLGLPTSEFNWPIAIGISFFGLAIPGGLGISILIGLGRNGVSVVTQGLIPVVTLALVALALALDGSTGGVLILTGVSYAAGNWACLAIALRQRPVRRARHLARGDRRSPTIADASTSLRSTALPMMLIMGASALTFQVGRLTLAHTGTLADVAVYAAAWLTFQPVLSLVQVASLSLWPRFALARSGGSNLAPAIYREALTINLVLGGGGAVGLMLLGPFISRLAVGGSVDAPLGIFAVLGLVVLVQASYQPSAMYLTDPRGLRFQAVTGVGTAVGVSLLTYPLSSAFQGLGAAVALLVGVLCFQALPCFISARLRMRQAAIASA
jgi:O-antigen/teichoic acid export membrane protein